MKAHSVVLIPILLSLALVISPALAQQEHQHAAPAQAQTAPAAPAQEKAQCPHRAGVMTAMQKLEQALSEGQQATDPAKMKAAIEAAQAQLKGMKQHMSMCPMMSGEHAMMDHRMMQGAKPHEHMQGRPGQQQTQPPKE